MERGREESSRLRTLLLLDSTIRTVTDTTHSGAVMGMWLCVCRGTRGLYFTIFPIGMNLTVSHIQELKPGGGKLKLTL